MREIPLTRAMVALVDDEDYEKVSQYKWQANWSGGHWYAQRTVRYGPRREGKKRTILMARVIMGAKQGEIVDHRDNEATLNNRRSNLRICTHTQNLVNSKKRAGCSSRYKGVSLDKRYNNWRAYIKVNRKYIHLGCFDDEDEAGRAYNIAALLHFGEFARVNVI